MIVYDAFVSYSHARDKPIAAALQSVVQTLGKPWYRRRALRVFRDDTSLSATPQLWPTIVQALDQSRFLILLASRDAAASLWVGKEVAYWLDTKGADTLLIALTDGDLAWDPAASDFAPGGGALPAVLTGRLPSEPKWVDLRAYRTGANARDSAFIEAGADLAAAIRGIPKEDLLSQELRQQRRALTLAWSATASLLVLAGAAGWQWWEAEAARQVADDQKAVAQVQRDRAERNFGIAKTAADRVVFRIAQGLRDVEGMRIESARQILDTARGMMDELARAAPEDMSLRRSRAVMLNEFVTTYLGVGDLDSARAAADESLAIARALVALDGDSDGVVPQHDLSVSLERTAFVRAFAGDLSGALAAFEECLAIRRRLMVVDADPRWRKDVSLTLGNIGDVRMSLGDLPGAVAAYEESLTVARALATSEPRNPRWQSELSARLSKVGQARQATGDMAAALAAFDEGLAIARAVAASDLGNTLWQREVAACLDRIGDLHLAMGDRVAALADFEEAVRIVRKLAALDPQNTDWQHGLAVTLDKVGSVRQVMGDRVAALAAYEESLAILRKLVASSPGRVGWQVDMAESLYHVSAVAEPERSRAVLQEALAVIEVLERDGKLAPDEKHWPQTIRDRLATLAPPDQAKAR
jgi:tetratricopeptide (TPR) repeat protein